MLTKIAALEGIINSLDKNGIISRDSEEVLKVASAIIEGVDFDPTSPADLQKVAVAFISLLDKVAQANKPDNFLDNAQTFAALLEKARTERNNVNKGRWGVGQSEMADKGLIGALVAAARDTAPGGKDNTLDADQAFAALLEKARKERDAVNKGVRGVGQSEMADKGVIGQTIKKASDEGIDIDELVKYLNS